MSDILSARWAEAASAPPLTGALRENLLRGARAALRRVQSQLAVRTHTSARTHTLRTEEARLRADIAEWEGMA